jgi:hypothetical protein
MATATATALATDLACALDPARLMAACGWSPDPWQRAVLRSTAPRRILLASRQAGKSVTRLRSPHRPLSATQNNWHNPKLLCSQWVRCFHLGQESLGWPTP